MEYLKLKIEKAYESVYIYLREHNFSVHYIINLRKNRENILVNDKPATTKTQLQIGDILKINKNPFPKTDIKKVDHPLNVVFQDENYLIINKPNGISTMPNRSHYDENLSGMIVNYASIDNFTLRILNRLDKDACGLIIVPLNSISAQMTVNIKKEYYAVCHGKIDNITKVEAPILTKVTDGINEMKRVCDPNGKYAKTTLTPIKIINDNTLVKAEIEKGRTHQIRVHCAHISHPIIGDKIYGTDSAPHLLLQLKKVSFFNILLQKNYTFEVPYPESFSSFIDIE